MSEKVYTISALRYVVAPTNRNTKIGKMRTVHPSFVGHICPIKDERKKDK